MAQEEETQKHSNSTSGGGFNMGNTGRSSKKQKQKKAPQRGLGVAQLEKIILEEQQKKDGSIILPSPSPISPARPSNFSVPLPSYQSFPSSITYPPDFTSPNSMRRPQNSDAVNSVSWQSVPVQGHGNATKTSNSCQHGLERQSFGIDTGLSSRSSFNFFCESNPIYPLPGLMQKAQKHLQTSHSSSSSSSMANASSQSISSSALSFQMEPPSNQSYHGNYTSVWQEEEKMVGMKRPYPFYIDKSPAPSLHCKIPPNTHPISKSDDQSGSFGNGEAHSFCSGNNNSREGPSCSCSILETNSRKSIRENGVFNGDFLTLAPPATDLTCPNSKFKHPSAVPAFNQCDTIVFGSLPYQGNMEDPVLQPVPTVPNPHGPYHSFLPTTVMQIGQATKNFGNCNDGEVGENVDLNLKL